MTWSDIDRGTGSHFVALDRLVPEAKKRLEIMAHDDLDELYSLRISGKQRLWGARTGRVLNLLWWDPQHAICPAPKKHT